MLSRALIGRTTLAVLGTSALLGLRDIRPASQSVRNVLIVTLDTTRADVLPAYGGTNVETPALDRLAREGVVFEQAMSSAPLTLPAHCSLLTGLFPPHHGVRDNVDAPLGDANLTLAEVAHANGLRSAAFVGSAVLGARRGLAQGFDTYSDVQRAPLNARLRRRGNVVVDEAIGWMTQRSDVPFLTWVHLYDAHAPYLLPEPYRTMYEDVPYLGAIAFMDAQIARLVNALEAAHLLDRTMIVVAADHGESLGDHGEDGHGILLYQSTLRVPLIVRLPGVAARRISDPVRLVDVMPTVLEALGDASPRVDGVSLLGLMKGQIPHLDLEAYSESLYPRRFGWSELRALRTGRFKYVSAPRPELYDLEKDPGEARNLYDERRALAVAMATRLATLEESTTNDATRPPELDRESLERLSSLGYVAPVISNGTADAAGPRPNPADCIGVYNAIVRKGAPARADPVSGGLFLRPRVWDGHVSPCASEPLVSGPADAVSTHGSWPARQKTRTPRGASQ